MENSNETPPQQYRTNVNCSIIVGRAVIKPGTVLTQEQINSIPEQMRKCHFESGNIVPIGMREELNPQGREAPAITPDSDGFVAPLQVTDRGGDALLEAQAAGQAALQRETDRKAAEARAANDAEAQRAADLRAADRKTAEALEDSRSDPESDMGAAPVESAMSQVSGDGTEPTNEQVEADDEMLDELFLPSNGGPDSDLEG